MTRSEYLLLIIGMFFGALIGAGVAMHVCTQRLETIGQQLGQSSREHQETAATREAIIQQTAAAWQARAEKCEAKFTVGTIVYQKQPLASFPILNGLGALNIVDAGESKPSLYIPAQVDVYTDRPDVRYQWFDGHTGAPQGAPQFAHAPSEVRP